MFDAKNAIYRYLSTDYGSDFLCQRFKSAGMLR